MDGEKVFVLSIKFFNLRIYYNFCDKSGEEVCFYVCLWSVNRLLE